MKLAKAIVEQRCPVATRLLAACGRGDLQIVKELFETDLNQILAMAPLLRDSNGRTPLHFLCRGASCDEVKRLELLDLLLPHLSATEMLEVVDASGHTALACAAAKGNAAVLERLLRAGADANGGQSFTALMNCAEAGVSATFSQLLIAAEGRLISHPHSASTAPACYYSPGTAMWRGLVPPETPPCPWRCRADRQIWSRCCSSTNACQPVRRRPPRGNPCCILRRLTDTSPWLCC